MDGMVGLVLLLPRYLNHIIVLCCWSDGGDTGTKDLPHYHDVAFGTVAHINFVGSMDDGAMPQENLIS